jgi:hypothetical protein
MTASSHTPRTDDAPVLLTRRDLAEVLRISARTDRRRAGGDNLDALVGPGRPRRHRTEVAVWIKVGRPRAEVWRRLCGRRPEGSRPKLC